MITTSHIQCVVIKRKIEIIIKFVVFYTIACRQAINNQNDTTAGSGIILVIEVMQRINVCKG